VLPRSDALAIRALMGPAEVAGATGVVVGSPPPAGNAEATWLNAGAAEVQPWGTDRLPSDAARPDAAVTPPNSDGLQAPDPGPTPMSGDDLNIGKPPPKALVAGLKVLASDVDEPSIETPAVSMDADEAVPETTLVPDANALLEDVVVVTDDTGAVEDEVDVTVDASACTALGIAAELSGDTACAPVPADVPAAWVTAAASPTPPDELVVSVGVAKGVSNDAVDDAPA
jgi:hypothetical protein